MTTHIRGRRGAGQLIASMIALLVLSIGLGACSSADSGESASSGDVAADYEAAADAGAGSDAEAAPSEAAATAARAPAMQRHVISTGTVSLASDDVATARRDVQRIVDAQRGSIAEENTETDDAGQTAYSRLVIRVPAASFNQTMQELEKVAELRQSHVASEDVTTDVIDTDVRVRAQQRSLQRVEALLARADTLKDIVWIESELTTRQADLDSLKSQQAWLSDQTSQSTITIDIVSVDSTPKESEDRSGFLVGLSGGMKALGSFAGGLATIVGALLPFMVVLIVLGVPTWLLVRRLARRGLSRDLGAVDPPVET